MSRKSGAILIVEERGRQIGEEGYDATHDDDHVDGELAIAGACYAVSGLQARVIETGQFRLVVRDGDEPLYLGGDAWPWNDGDGRVVRRPTVKRRIRELVKAGALIAAEIDRLQRRNDDEDGEA